MILSRAWHPEIEIFPDSPYSVGLLLLILLARPTR